MRSWMQIPALALAASTATWLLLALLGTRPASEQSVHELLPQASPLVSVSTVPLQSSMRIDRTSQSPKISLHGRNLVLAGDSNDERFFRFFCRRLTGIFDSIQYISEIVSPLAGEYHGRIRWPGAARIMACHDSGRNISAIFLFHQGLYSLPPQPEWYAGFAKRRLQSHYLAVEGKQRIIPTTDQALFIWPQVVRQLLPQRENILLFQSSMWDSFAVLEGITGTRVSQMTEAHEQMTVAARLSRRNLTDWGWLDRAAASLSAFRQGFQENGLEVAAVLWRTNANCPQRVSEGSAIAIPLNGLYAEAVQEARGRLNITCTADLLKHFDVQRPDQCDKHHVTTPGHEAYWIALSDCVLLPEITEIGPPFLPLSQLVRRSSSCYANYYKPELLILNGACHVCTSAFSIRRFVESCH